MPDDSGAGEIEDEDRSRDGYGDLFQWITVACMTVAGAALRLAFLFQPMRYDETITFFGYTNKPLAIALAKNNPPCNPLFHTFLVNTSTRVFGGAEWAIRLPAFLAGVAAIPVSYLVFRKLFNRWAGLIAAGLVAASSIMVMYSTNARAYTVQALLFLLLILVALHLKEKKTARGWVAFVVLGTMAFYTQPTTLYFFGGLVVWMGLSALVKDVKENRPAFLVKLAGSCVAIAVLTALLYIPVALRSGLETVTSNPMVKSVPYRYFLRGTWQLALDTWNSWNLDINPVLSVILGAGFLLGIVFYRRLTGNKVDLAMVLVGFSLLVLVVQSAVACERHWLPLLPVFFGYAGAGLHFAFKNAGDFLAGKGFKLRLGPAFWCAAVLAVSLFLGALVYASQTPYQLSATGIPSRDMSFRDAKWVAAELAGELEPGDLVYIDHIAMPTLEYYFRRNSVPVGYIYANMIGAENIGFPRRIFVVEAFGELHTIAEAVRDRLSPGQLESAELWKKTDDTRIFVIQDAQE